MGTTRFPSSSLGVTLTGSDADGDSLGDLPYISRSLFENMMDQNPQLRLFQLSPAQQAEDYALLEALAVVPGPGGDAAADPAGKLSAWLLSQTNLVGER